ncbi:MAG: formimidoylglutamase [Flavobacteriales bacterium]
MTELDVFFQPVGAEFYENLPKDVIGDVIQIHTESMFPDLTESKLALIGVQEERNSLDNSGTASGPDHIRKHFYRLFNFDTESNLADLGNIAPGQTTEDTFFAVKNVCAELIKADIIPIVIGGSQDITYANYAAYESLEQTINLVTVDSKLDVGDNDEDISCRNFMSKIILHQPNYLFNYSNIGHQRYLQSPSILELMEKLHFETMRLGEVTGNIQDSEPLLRNADLVSFDTSVIRWSDFPGSKKSGPNGLYAEEACQLARYAGISDKLTSVGFYEYNPEVDRDGTSAHLVAQMIWCFVDGVLQRKNDYPKGSKESYTKYIIDLVSSDHQIVFYKSDRSDRWWMDVPYPAGMKNRYERHHFVPCTYNDYVVATNEEMPDKWWKTYQKLV